MSAGRMNERAPGADLTLVSEGQTPLGAPTRRTLSFPSAGRSATGEARALLPPALPSGRPTPPVPSRDDGIPAPRPSERPTQKTLPPVDEASSGHSNTQIMDVSVSDLDGLPSVRRPWAGLVRAPLEVGKRLSRWGRRPPDALARRLAVLSSGTRGGGTTHGRPWAPAVAVAIAALGGLTCGAALSGNGAAAAGRSGGTAHHSLAPERTPLVLRGEHQRAAEPLSGCTASGPTRALGRRALTGVGLDVNATDGGFGIAFATSGGDALGLVLNGNPLRVADRILVKGASGARHVAVEGGQGTSDAIELLIDRDEGRTLVPEGEGAAFRLSISGGWVQWSTEGVRRPLWPAPAVSQRSAVATGSAPVDASAKAGGAPSGMGLRGFSKVGALPPRPASANPPIELRAASRDDGGAVVALHRGSSLWVGLVDGAPLVDGPLLNIHRPTAALGAPSVAPWGGGGAVAWAERSFGEREWNIVVASFDAADGAARERPTFRSIGAGMSPSLAALPDGDLLLAYAVGPPNAHRVLVRRLAHDLEPRGEPIEVSPSDLNAGQPVIAVAADSRALVGFLAAERGRPSRVLATPMMCALSP